MRPRVILLVSIAVAAVACGGGDDDSAPDVESVPESSVVADVVDSTDPTEIDEDRRDESAEESGPVDVPADLPAECAEAPFDLTVTIDGFPQAAGTLSVEGAAGTATPIVPNGDGSLDDLDMAGYRELGAETDLLTYTQWVGDFAFGPDDLGFLGGAPTLPGENLALGLSVTPPTETGLAAGDVVSSDDELAYDSITTFGTATVFLVAPEESETYLFTSGNDERHGGTATVLYVDDDWLCVDWDLAGATANPDGTYSVTGVVLTPITRGDTPFT